VKVVLDTNVLIAGLVAHGACAELLEDVLENHELVISTNLLEEFERVMVAKLRFSKAHVARAVSLLRHAAQCVEVKPPYPALCRDPNDNAVLALVLAAEPTCLVTGDDDLLVLQSVAGVPIVRPRGFWAIAAQQETK
jgi:putative PIN family toxin of toxin-antitoxin system